LRQLKCGNADDPVEAYLQFKRGQSKRSRKAANEIAQIKEAIGEGKPKTTETEGPTVSPPVLPLAVGPVKAHRLRIPSGYT